MQSTHSSIPFVAGMALAIKADSPRLLVKNIFWTILYAIALQTRVVPSLASLVHYWLVKCKQETSNWAGSFVS